MAVDSIRAGSEPTPGSVSKKALRLGDPDRLVRAQQRANRRVTVGGNPQRPAVVDLRETKPAVLRRHLHPKRPDPLQRVHHVVGDPRLALDFERVGGFRQYGPELGEKSLALLDRLGIQPRLRMDQVEPEVAQEQLLAKARQLPLGLPRRLDDVTSFFL
jgi:hypothetical protein